MRDFVWPTALAAMVGELALACDMRFASAKRQSSANWRGLRCRSGRGAMEWLAHLSGAGARTEIVRSADDFDADTPSDMARPVDRFRIRSLTAFVDRMAGHITSFAPGIRTGQER